MNTADRSPPYTMPAPAPSPLPAKLRAVLAAQRALAQAADDLANTWAADLSTRNRPNRQKLTAALMATLPKPRALGDAVYAIADECGEEI